MLLRLFAKKWAIIHVVGARPNFIKLAPVYRAIAKYPQLQQLVVHTGQHYDFNMSDVFFQQLQICPPDINLQIGEKNFSCVFSELRGA